MFSSTKEQHQVIRSVVGHIHELKLENRKTLLTADRTTFFHKIGFVREFILYS